MNLNHERFRGSVGSCLKELPITERISTPTPGEATDGATAWGHRGVTILCRLGAKAAWLCSTCMDEVTDSTHYRPVSTDLMVASGEIACAITPDATASLPKPPRCCDPLLA